MPENKANSAVPDAVWGALNDPTRRQILDWLRESPLTTGEICDRVEMTRFGVMKHLKVLEQAGLVFAEKRGRSRINHLNPVPLQQIYRRWIAPFEALPADRLLAVKQLSEQRKEARQ